MLSDTPTVRGGEKLRRRIATIRRAYALPPLVNEIGVLLLRRTLDRFDRQLTPEGTLWAPLKDTTLARKKREGFGDKPSLVRTNEMRKSIRVLRGMATGAVYTNTGAGLRIGIDNPEAVSRARANNAGTSRIQARRFLGVGRLDIKAVDSLLRRHVSLLKSKLDKV